MKDALESVMAQSLTEIEILTVDDGSTDRTGKKFLEDYSQRMSGFGLFIKRMPDMGIR